MMDRLLRPILPILFGLSLLVVGSLPVQAQFPAAGGSSKNQETVDRVFPPPDRHLRQRLDTAEALLEQRRFSEAVRSLASILDAPEDYFFRRKPTAKEKSQPNAFLSLKSEAIRLIGEMPLEARRSYELQFGDTARRSLEKALEENDMAGVADVSRRFFHTKAGYESTMLLGRHHMNHGRMLAAAFCFERVNRTEAAAEYEPVLSVLLATCWQRSGQPKKAEESLRALSRRDPHVEITIGGNKQKLFDAQGEAPSWQSVLAQYRPLSPLSAIDWAMYLGNPARTAKSAGGRPLMLKPFWKQRIVGNAARVEMLAEKEKELRNRSELALPAAHPLAMHDMILMRTPRNLVAVDFITGKRIWQVATHPSQGLDSQSDFRTLPSDVMDNQAEARKARLFQRVWNDKTYGTMSSDGDLVFAINEESDLAAIDNSGRRWIDDASTHNVLAAYEVSLSQGKLRWSVGGPNGVEPALEQVFFLGPPLPLEGLLYALVEQDREIRLVVLDAETGRLQWLQHLTVMAEGPVNRNQFGRLQELNSGLFRNPQRLVGLSPSFAEGVLVCPTEQGGIVAVDLSTRALLWGYQYSREEQIDRYGNRRLARVPGPGLNQRARFVNGRMIINGRYIKGPISMAQPSPTEWADSNALISEGKVIVTSLDSMKMVCLDLATGRLQWERDRVISSRKGTNGNRQDHYVACIHNGQTVIVGAKKISAVPLIPEKKKTKRSKKTSQAEWSVTFPENMTVSGRGFYSENHYYLPLVGPQGGEVIKIDLDKHQIVARATSHDRTIPGNLICYRGKIISQGVDHLQAFFQVKTLQERVAKALQEDPEDAWARTLQGELLLDANKPLEAIPHLRHAYGHYTRKLKSRSSDSKDVAVQGLLADQSITQLLLFDSLLAGLEKDVSKGEVFKKEIESLSVLPREHLRYLRVYAESLALSGNLSEAMEIYSQLAEDAIDSPGMLDLEMSYSVQSDLWIRARIAELVARFEPAEREAFDKDFLAKLEIAAQSETPEALKHLLRFYGSTDVALKVRERLVSRAADGDNSPKLIGHLESLARQGDLSQSRQAVARLATLFASTGQPLVAANYYRRLVREWSDEVCFEGKTGRQLFEALPAESPILARISTVEAWPAGKVSMSYAEATPKDIAYSSTHDPRPRRVVQSRSAVSRPVLPMPLTLLSRQGDLSEHLTIQLERQRLVGRDHLGNLLWTVDVFKPGTRHTSLTDVAARIQDELLIVSFGYQVLGIDLLEASQGRPAILWRTELDHLQTDTVLQNQPEIRQHQTKVRQGMRQNLWHNGTQVQGTGVTRMKATLGPIASGAVTCIQNRDLVSLDTRTGEVRWIRHGVMPYNASRLMTLFGDDQVVVAAHRNDLEKIRNARGDSANPDEAQEFNATIYRATDGKLLSKVVLPKANLRFTTEGRRVLTWRDDPSDEMKKIVALVDPLTQKDIWTYPVKVLSRGALVGRDEIALLEKTGKLAILDLKTGRERWTQQIQVEPKLISLNVVRDDRRYLVMTGRTPEKPPLGQSRSSYANTIPFTGRVYAFDRSSGDSLWPVPATLKNQDFQLDQPRELPLLIWSEKIKKSGSGNSRSSNNKIKTKISFFDKRTGRLLSSRSREYPSGAMNYFAIVADVKSKKIHVQSPASKIVAHLNYTDKPIAPAPPVQQLYTEPQAKKVFKSLFRALGI